MLNNMRKTSTICDTYFVIINIVYINNIFEFNITICLKLSFKIKLYNNIGNQI